jgi:hypothetical protein
VFKNLGAIVSILVIIINDLSSVVMGACVLFLNIGGIVVIVSVIIIIFAEIIIIKIIM